MRSNSTSYRPFLLAIATTTGCAHTAAKAYVDPPPIRASEFDAAALRSLGEGNPVILQFHAGDRIPVELVVDGDVITTDPATATFALQAQRDFFLRIRGGELKTSFDGQSFDEKPAVPGAFRIGLEKTSDHGPVVSVHITTPVHSRR